ncbi:universal stress protein [Mucilaginibacter aquariorum]|uniref:Universal stress protein n=1 Tax=Mucilaginibacter aquariorum TaxID=2967225 RepID=A0ABT1T3H7_9SPHI|nr:universal stress protein [Mucilaginibacter aquariorum]MCQ6959161.1 universal stress protein [Mucilaginibacter aquariorum]
MKRILLAIDTEKLDRKSLDFGCYLAQLTHSALTGVFLGERRFEPESGVKFAYGGIYVETIDARELPETQYRQKVREKNLKLFKSTCEELGVAYHILRDQTDPVKDLIAESRYADLLVVDPELLSTSPLDRPSAFVKDVLAGAECSVIISPYYFNEVNEIVFAYDGQPSSVFAIKQFTYLFPQLFCKKITVMQANEAGVFRKESEEKIHTYLKAHYVNIEFQDLVGKPDDQLFDHLLRKNDAFVIMGAYGRTKLSNFFKHSTAELLIEVNGLPIFIAHH